MLKLFFIQLSEPDLFISGHEDVRTLVCGATWAETMTFRSKKVAATRLLGELLVRYALKTCFGWGKGDYEIVRGEHGKPYVTGQNGAFFNLSHSGEYIVCAVSDGEVGVDVERRGVARLAVSSRFFETREQAILSELTGEEQSCLFFDYWSVKESFLKYTGSGLSRSLSSFYVDKTPAGISIYEGTRLVPVFIHPCAVNDAYSCFICSANSITPEMVPLELSFYNKLFL